MEYHSYLIRLWREGAHNPWRISLQDTASGERKGFATLGEAVEFLACEIEQGESQPTEDDTNPNQSK